MKIRVQPPLGFPSVRRATALGAVCGLAAALGGCANWDSWFDPSVMGRWEVTPASVPILSRLASIEGPEDEFVEQTEVTAEDLLPDATVYRIGPGDVVNIVIWDVPVPQAPTPFDRLVDPRGLVDLPIIGEVNLNGLTIEEARNEIARVMAEKDLVKRDALVSVQVTGPRQQTFSVMGATSAGGSRPLTKADYRILDVIADTGGVPQYVRELYIIRQAPLSAAVEGPRATPAAPPEAKPPTPGNEQLIDLIDEITGEKKPGGSPGVMGAGASAAVYRQPARQPEVDLVEAPSGPSTGAPTPGGSWMFLNNEWVRVQAPAQRPGAPAPAADGLPRRENLVTQRIIRVPIAPLLAGDARYNIVIRPGDIIHIPLPPSGQIYLGGEVRRPGAFNLAPDLTLMRAFDAAGGLSAIGVAERVDLVRFTGRDRQGMIRLNVRAINEGTQPDIYLKPGDRINVGTSFWMYPLAVVRSGFRATYGFGFVLDRNFGNDVFGPPPRSSIFDQ